MSKKVLQYSETRFYKTKKQKKKFSVFFALLIICVCVLFVFLLSGAFSSALKISTLSFLFSKNNKIQVASHSYYAVSLGNYTSESEAQNVASGASVLGAGAYVWFNDGKYYVIGNVYEKKDDALKVIENLKESKYICEVVNITYKGFSFNHENYTKEQREAILNCIKFIDELYKKCYNYSIQFDLSEIVATVVSSELNTLKGSVKINSSKLDAINSVSVTSEALLIKNAYVLLEQELETGVLKVIDGKSVNKDLKYLTTAIAIIKYNLYKQINNLI